MKFCKTMNEVLPRQQCRFVHFICYFNQLQSIDQLQKMTIFPKSRQLLHYICLYGHLHLFKDLIKAIPQINLNFKDQDSTTPLILAFKNKQLSIIHYMMRFPVTNLNEGSTKYGYPLHLGVKNHDFSVVLKMLRPKHVVNINAKDTEGNNTMHFLMGHFGYDSLASSKIGILLLKKGIEVNILNKQEFSPIHVAIKAFQAKALKFALEYNQYLKTHLQKLLLIDHHAYQEYGPGCGGTSPLSRHMRMEKFDFNTRGKNMWTPLHYAVYNNNLIAVEILLHAQHLENIDVLARDNENKLAQELCPYNSPIYKMIVRRQNQVIKQRLTSHHDNSHNDSTVLSHTHINHGWLTHQRQKVIQQKRDHQQLRRVNSNNMLLPNHAKGRLMFNNVQDINDSNDESLKHQIRESIINQNTVERNKTVERVLAVSKTEKNLHSFNPVFLTSHTTRQNIVRPQMDDLGKRSPRLQHPIPPLPPKHLFNHDEDHEFEELFRKDTIQQPDYLKFMSHQFNFDSDSGNQNKSMSVEEDSISEESMEEDVVPKFTVDQNFQRTERFKQLGVEVQQVDNNYSSAPAERKSVIRVEKEDSDQDGSPMKTQQKDDNEGEDDDDEEDFCDAADEDAEAGTLGLIANKINKFDNHNKDEESKSVNEREMMKKIIQQMENILQRKNLIVKSCQSRYSKQHLSPRIQKSPSQRDIQNSLDNPFDQRRIDSPQYLTTNIRDDDEGNVFDTVERFPEYNDEEAFSPKSMYNPQAFGQRNIKQRTNIFVHTKDLTPKVLKSQHITTRKSKVEDSFTNNSTYRKQLQTLNKDCKLESVHYQNRIEECIKIMNDEHSSLSQKYNTLYQVIYQQGKIIDEHRIKQLFDSLDSTNHFAQIIKADLSYLLSLSKNKEFIPQLDSALSKYKKQAIKDLKDKQSPEPTSKKVDLKTPIEEVKSENTLKRNQSNCKNLIIYETCNAFDVLMQDAMIQSKHMMEQCNSKIHLERERSREKMKMKIIKVKPGQIMQTSASGDLGQFFNKQNYDPSTLNSNYIMNSIKDVPEFVSRLHKSPSGQNIYNLKKLSAVPSNANLASHDSLGKSQQHHQSNNHSIDSQNNSNHFFKKKISFTPKGSSGQVFLAFQRQRQTHQQEVQSPTRPFDIGLTPSYKLSEVVIPENFNETLIHNPQRPQYLEPLSHAKILQTARDISSLNMSASSNTTTPFQGQNLAVIISNTISELRQDNSLGQLDCQAMINQLQLKQQQLQQQKGQAFTFKQRELSQQIKVNLAVKQASKQTPVASNNNSISNTSTVQSNNKNLFTPLTHSEMHKSQSTQKLFTKPLGSMTQRRTNKLTISKQSPGKVTRFNDVSVERMERDVKVVEERVKKSLQHVQYNKGQLRKQEEIPQYHPQVKGHVQQAFQGSKFQVKQVKYNLNGEQQISTTARTVKKSTSTSKLTSDSSIV